MIKFDNQCVSNFENAIRGMRNPLESWGKSDSYFGLEDDYSINVWDVADDWVINEIGKYEEENKEVHELRNQYMEWLIEQGILRDSGDGDDVYEVAYIGPKDLNLAQSLVRAGTDEAKFMRQIFISVDITAPLYWWKEMDTYKVGTVANSTSTMHKLTSRPFQKTDFSFDEDWDFEYNLTVGSILKTCETLRQKYVQTKDKRYWRALIQLLPESYNQTRTWTANYAVLRNIYFARRNHKLQEWRDFCKWIETLPWAKELICLEEKKEK